jgi:signal transduction histidine kinase
VNLFTNAAHAARENDARLTVEGELDGDPHCAKIRVTDNGTGIQESDLAYIFDPFFTTKCDGRGNGLGLAIVRDIVDGHGGHIDVSSQVGHGTTFSICLPVVSDDED